MVIISNSKTVALKDNKYYIENTIIKSVLRNLERLRCLPPKMKPTISALLQPFSCVPVPFLHQTGLLQWIP